MKVAIINNDFRVYWRGRLIFLREYLAGQGIQLHAIELFGKGSPYDFDTANKTLDWWSCIYPDKSAADVPKEEIKAAIFKSLDAIEPDVVIGPSIVFFAGALGIAWAKKHKRKFIMFDDARPAQVKRNAVVQWVKNLITSRADGFWLPSKSYDNDYANFKQQGVHFFYGFACIDNSLFKGDSAAQSRSKTIICVARLVPIKNLDALLTAWREIEQQNTGYKLAIVGDGPEKESLARQAETLQLQTVEFVSAVSNVTLPLYLGRAGAFILPSLSETWGLVVNEAMAAGLPVLLSRTVNAANDLLQEGVNGFGFDAFDTKSIVSAISSYIHLTDAAKEAMSAQSVQLIGNMSYQKMGEQLADALNVLANSPYKKPGIIAAAIIGRWHGRYNTGGWDKL